LEVWEETEFVNYQISNIGRVKNKNTQKILKPVLNSGGYYQVFLEKKAVKIHRLVAKSFINDIFDKKEVNHKNGIKTDNRVYNLEWVTASENMKHAYKNGLNSKKGEKHSRNILKNDDIIKIYENKNNLTQKELSKLYKVGVTQINKILCDVSWTHITKKLIKNNFKIKHKWINEGKISTTETPGGEKRIEEEELQKISEKRG
jgi:hypothetical protein